MKNYIRLASFLFLLILAFSPDVSAGHYYNTYTYTDNFIYSEDLKGDDRGFSVAFPRSKYGDDCGYRDWTADGRKCKRTAYYDKYYVEYYGYNVNKDRDSYDKNKVVSEAFRTYQQSSRQEYQLELKRIENDYKRYSDRYRYGGYGYGYSGHRYYYGW